MVICEEASTQSGRVINSGWTMSEEPFLYEPTNQSLPPSPEHKSRRHEHVIDSEFSLDNIEPPIVADDKTKNVSRRLRAVARYQAFHPQALACSDILTSSLDSNIQEDSFTPAESSSGDAQHQRNNNNNNNHHSSPNATTSLGAIAGSQGVALFRLSRPHVPLLILSHATSFRSKALSNISGLAFHSTKGNQLYLAAARGSATLVWDASGHSNMPLIGRLGSDNMLSQDAGDNGKITSICWKPSSRKASAAPLLATTTSNSISLWDLRVAPQGSTSSSKPSLRFAVSKRSSFSPSAAASPMILQVACAPETDECACMDRAGVVRIYDIRMNERNRTSSSTGSTVSMFQAHDAAGVGLCAFKTTTAGDSSSSSSSWLTWGLDSSSASPVVKCWAYQNDDATSTADPDDYWYMTPAPYNQSHYYGLKAQLTKPNLAAARVCPSPFENSFLAVGHLDSTKNSDDGTLQHGWWAEMCQLTPGFEGGGSSPTTTTTASGSSFGLETTIRFEGGATAKRSHDQEALYSALGGQADLGRLQAAELAFGSIPSQGRYLSALAAAAAAADGDPKSDDDRGGGNRLELVLCCLSDTSVITTHSVAEVETKVGGEIGRRTPSPLRTRMVKTSFPTSHQPRVYQEDRNEGSSLVDAAGFWNTTATGAVDAHKALTEELGRLSMNAGQSPDAMIQSADPDSDDPIANQQQIGDMEVPVAYGSVSANKGMAMTDIASGTVVSTGGLRVVSESENATVDVREATPILENIESGRVPCPPLCGASFGFGHGGLVMFHNGEINKMWNWYQRTDTMRLHSMPNGKGDIGPSGNELLPPRVGVDSDTKLTAVYGPRTLKELVKMTETAKEAQWGARAGSDSSESGNDNLTTDENFFEDESSDSDSSDDEDVGVPSRNHMYNRYFGARAFKGSDQEEEEPATHRRTNSDASASTPTKNAPEIVGPSYEMLAPAVRVTRDFDREIISNQRVELAQTWELGAWEDLSAPEDLAAESKMAEYYDMASYDGAIPPQILGQGLPGYKYLEPGWGNSPNLPRAKSESNLDFGMLPEGDDTPRYFRNMSMYPSDNPAQWDGGHHAQNNLPRNPRREDGTLSWNHLHRGDKRKRYLELGVYKLRELPTPEIVEAIAVLDRIKSNCHKNANACKLLNEIEKEGVWRLLEETVDGQIKNLTRSMDGGIGRALGTDLVSNLFSYYESLGDVQMLATMFCVLSGGVRSTMQGSPKLLPPGHDEKYDAYIKKYAELLYAWNLLSIRAEVRKHLRRIPQQRNKESAGVLEGPSLAVMRLPYRGNETELSMEDNNNTDAVTPPAVAIVIRCPGCDYEIDLNKQGNYCKRCQDFPFRCSLCDNAVRGQFTFCSSCKHGGHLDHITEWFTEHVQCPTGCGCRCKFADAMTAIHIE
ncbi:unnamed protein product [Cylindrotheca closterium]|uniref:WDR59/RTC1-like RING zinc finger domain-containing protein n=1 Tax=Cylindrotheca closterium TaxID=2856 RepID=A0AAD2FRN4_9STRA|nr:unnamed protein product [Cylindrotheca closterium]